MVVACRAALPADSAFLRRFPCSFATPWERRARELVAELGQDVRRTPPLYRTIIAANEDQIVGALGWQINDEDTSIADGLVVAVATTARRQGVARLLIERFLTDAANVGCIAAINVVHHQNTPMLRFWRAFGAVEDDDDDVRFKLFTMPL